MNRNYRLIWNSVRSAWMVVSELARAHGKGGAVLASEERAGGTSGPMAFKPLRVALALAFIAPASLLAAAPDSNALPTGGQVMRGNASISTSGNVMDIRQTTQRAVLNWQSFDIGQNGTVNFIQPNSSAVALNRVLGNNASRIYGHLNANGQVFLLNPNGSYFAPGSQVNVGGLVASTLRMNDDDFMAGNYRLSAPGTGLIESLGEINAVSVILAGNNLSNSGRIIATTVSLVSGNEVAIDLTGNNLLRARIIDPALSASISNSGTIQAASVTLTAGQAKNAINSVVNNSGSIKATALISKGGEIYLTGTTVTNTGTLDASGATGGGKIELMGDMQSGRVNAGGTLKAEATQSGDGGFIETSAAHVKVADDFHASTLAAHGKTGTWLIDPNDFTIAASGGDMTGAQVQNALASSNVSYATTTDGHAGGNGDININDAITWSANTLTLTAERNININAVMTANGNSQLCLVTGAYGGAVNVGMNGSGFVGRVDFAGRSGRDMLFINGNNYTVINSLGAQGSTSGADLQGIKGPGGNLAGYYALGSDIDASVTSRWNGGSGFDPIGGVSEASFYGSFNGLGHVISNLTINRTRSYVGLFGSTDSRADIRNVGVTGAVTGQNEVGGLVGSNNGKLSNSFSRVAVSGQNDVGGLVGVSGGEGSSVRYAYASGSVSGQNNVGGLIGKNSGYVDYAYAVTGTVMGQNNVGGLIGENSGSVNYTYAASGTVSGHNNKGGLVGLSSGNVNNSFWDTQTTGLSTSDGGTGKTTAQMQQASTYTAAGWDGTNIWTLSNGAYPMLRASGLNSGGGGGGGSCAQAAVCWTGGAGDNNWFTAGNWSTNAAPTSSQSVYINVDGSLATINFGSGSATVASLTSNESLNLSGSLTVSGATTFGTGSALQIAGAYGGASFSGATSLYDFVMSGGNLGGSGALTISNSYTFTGGSINRSGSLTITQASGNLNLGAMRVSSLKAKASNGGININGQINTSSSGNAIVLDGVSISNYAGSGTLNASGGGRWLVYASAPGNVSKGGLTSNFRHYGLTSGTYANPIETGNGFIYASTPLLGVNTTLAGGSASHTYGSTSTATFNGTIITSNFADSEDTLANIGLGGTARFTTPSANSHAGSYSVGYQDGLTSSAGYGFTAGTSLAYTVTPKTLTISGALAADKTYDGTTSATLSNIGSLNGLVNGDTLNLTGYNARFDNKNAGSGKTVTITYSLGNGSGLASDYQLTSTSATTTASITPKTINAIVTAQNKTYDGTNAAQATGRLEGAIAGDQINYSATAAHFNDANVGNGKTVVIDGFALSGADSGNYSIGSSQILSTTANITPARLTVIANNSSKTYDGQTYSGGQGVSYNGFVNGENETVLGGSLSYGGTAQGAKNAGSYSIEARGLNAANYEISYQDGSLVINKRAVSVSITGNPSKTKDGNTNASLTASDFAIEQATAGSNSGVVSGESLSITQTQGQYDSAEVGSRTVTAQLSPNQYQAGANTQLDNYILPTTATGPGTIKNLVEDKNKVDNITSNIVNNANSSTQAGASSSGSSSDKEKDKDKKEGTADKASGVATVEVTIKSSKGGEQKVALETAKGKTMQCQ